MATPVELTPKRKALRSLTYGIYIVSVKHEDRYGAAIVTWLSQSALDPSQIMLALRRDGKLNPLIKAAGKFAVNLPAADQKKQVSTFFKGANVDGYSINGWPFRESPSGAPLFDGAAYYLECQVSDFHDGPDHDIVIADVLDGILGTDTPPLTLKDTGWKYGG